MSKLTAQLRRADGGYMHWCPGCDEAHFIAVHKPLANGAQWSFDGNLAAANDSRIVRLETLSEAQAESLRRIEGKIDRIIKQD